MKRLFVLVVAAGSVLSCNMKELWGGGVSVGDDQQEETGGGLRDFSFSVSSYDWEGNETIKEWRDSVVLSSIDGSVEIAPGGTGIDWEGMTAQAYEVIDCSDYLIQAKLKVYPENTTLRGLSITSADTNLVKILSTDSHSEFILNPLGVGDTKIIVSVNDGQHTVKKIFPVKVMATVTMKLYIDSFWKNPELDRIRYKMSGVPYNVGPLVFAIRDSLAIDAECKWRDVKNAIYDEEVVTKSYCFESKVLDRAYRADRRSLLRDFGESMDYFLTLHKYGTEYMGDSDEIIDVCYDYFATHARLFIDVFSNNPYLMFNTVVKCNEDVYAVDNYFDPDYDDNDNEEVALKYFDVFLNERATSVEMDQMQGHLQQLLMNIGTEAEDTLWLQNILSEMSDDEVKEFYAQLNEFRK